MFNFPKDINRRKLWINAIKHANWTPTKTQEFLKFSLKNQCFCRSLQKDGGIWYMMQFLLYLNIIKIKNKRKLPFNRKRDAEELQREQRILMLEHSFVETHGTSNKEDYPDQEAQKPFSSDIFIQGAPEIEVLTDVPCSNCINLGAANKSLSAKIQHLQVKIVRNKASIRSTKKKA
nr:uncharacterized protein LOC121117073 [Lepeophtheirus salmonis]XP_040567307.1 uncharacterized protein LOC121117073 [Lepeophtheirus salmonis]